MNTFCMVQRRKRSELEDSSPGYAITTLPPSIRVIRWRWRRHTSLRLIIDNWIIFARKEICFKTPKEYENASLSIRGRTDGIRRRIFYVDTKINEKHCVHVRAILIDVNKFENRKKFDVVTDGWDKTSKVMSLKTLIWMWTTTTI